ncbi:MAG TPA: DUF2797 domain-containing protein [Pseudomonadales bacterium]|jgi:hypothetical protein|nr:DUF2797 domain-containing protein [Pseudomonadales bacterium]|tara:strand:+ start:8079 stop:8915 length:837 start_codon:yes stop_codon:yes gene_type:complete
MHSIAHGTLSKMASHLAQPVEYSLRLGDEAIALNPHLRQKIKLRYTGAIFCESCGRKTKRSFSQGYCYPCFKKLASCDLCVVSPDRCHYDQGTCRDPEWGERFCMQPHLVYLANSSAVKVGITKPDQLPTRWIDQGASQALPVMRVATRQQSGLVEVIFKQEVSDRTQWQTMLKSEGARLDLRSFRDELFATLDADIQALQQRFGIQAIQNDLDAQPVDIEYPVQQYPTKVVSLNFDKQPNIEGILLGIKGQYLIFDIGVINIRKFTSYEVELGGQFT